MMRSNKALIGALSLSMALAVGAAGYTKIDEQITKDSVAYHANQVNSEYTVEKTANEIDVLTYSGNVKASGISLGLDSKDALIKSVKKTVLKNSEKKNSKKQAKNNTKTKVKSSKKKTKAAQKKNTKKKTKKSSAKKAAAKPKLKYMGNYKVTAYCSCAYCCGKTNGVTASGTKATAGRTIAADTSVLPFGTKVVIDGHTYTVEDRGGAIKSKKIDVFFNTHQEALNWGVKYLDVYVQE